MAPPEKVRVVVVHGEHLTAQALQRALGSERDLQVPAATADPGAAVVLALEVAPDVVVVDLGLAHDEAVETIRRMADASPGTGFVALSEGDDLAVARAVEAGASGHVPKSAPVSELAEAVRAVARGDTLVGPEERRHLLRRLRHRRAEAASAEQRAGRLTRREVQILQLMADGVPAEALAQSLAMSPATLRTHMQNIIIKLGVHSKTEALAFAIRHGRVVTGR